MLQTIWKTYILADLHSFASSYSQKTENKTQLPKLTECYFNFV